MPNYRRYRAEGGSYFFTVVTDGRSPLFEYEDARGLLGRVIRECQAVWPFDADAMVLLPDHLHAVCTLPAGDDEYSKRWGWIKKEFTKRWLAEDNSERPVSAGRRREGRRGIWQPRFWEHLIRDDDDFAAHVDYVHYNPVKHGYVTRPADWPWSTFCEWVRVGVYAADWGAGDLGRRFDEIAARVGE